jgi:adiponectin receptor
MHVFVVAAAFVHYHGISKLAKYRLTIGDCLAAHTDADFVFDF